MNPTFSEMRGYVLVEFPVLLFMFSQSLAGQATMSLLFSQSTKYLLEIRKIPNGEIIRSRGRTPDFINNILMYKSFIEILVPALLMFVLGSWSDRYGRKPLLVAACAGSALSFLLSSMIGTLIPFNPLTILGASVPAALVGGYCTVLLATHCYITDIRKESDRAWHFTWLQIVLFIGLLLGYIADTEISDDYSYVTIFRIASALNVIATFYVLFFFPETVTQCDAKLSLRSLFNPSLIKDMFETCVRKRDGCDRVLIWCCVCILAINMLIARGELNSLFEFTFTRFPWNKEEYFLYLVRVTLLIITGTILGGLICKALIDPTMASMSIAVLATTSALAGSIAKSCATESWHFYLSAFLGLLGGLSGPVVRNALSKSVPSQEVGKVFALMTSMEAVIIAVAGQFYRMLSVHYPGYPSPMYLVSAGLYAFTILIVLTIKWRISKLFVLNHPPSTDAVELQKL